MNEPPQFSQYPREGAYGYGMVPGQDRPPGFYLDFISEGWNLFKRNWTAYVLATLVCVVLLVAVYAVYYTFKLSNGTLFSTDVSPSALIRNFVEGITFGSAIGCLTMCFAVGMINMAVIDAKGGEAKVGNMFAAFPKILHFFAISLVTSIVSTLGFMCCIVPGILVTALFFFAPAATFFENLNPIAAIQRSVDLVRPFMWMGVAFTIVLYLFASFGLVCTLYLGAFIVLPVSAIATALQWLNLTQVQTPPAGMGYAPIN